ncbi:MAG: transcriptional regulator [Bacteroidota bacterium]|nr:transcriptional regulator [Bacteroidota bacterium]
MTTLMTDEKLKIRLGKKIKELRESKGFTQLDIATICDFEKTSISRIEGGRTNVTLGTLNKLSKALNVDLKELFEF